MVHTQNGRLLRHNKDEILPFATIRLEMGIIMLSGKGQEYEEKYVI